MSTMPAVLDEIAERLRRDLVFIGAPEGNRLFVDTPVLFPNGASVVVQISAISDAVFCVSDSGIASFEAKQICVDKSSFSRLAKHAAEAIGARYEAEEICSRQVSRDELLGSVMLIANCAQKTVFEATAKQATRLGKNRYGALVDALYDRLAQAFSSQRWQKNGELAGASEHNWTFDALVKSENGADKLAVFDAVSDHAHSLNSAVTKFYDVKQLENPPVRLALIKDEQEFAPDKVTLLAGLCSIVTSNTSLAKIKAIVAGTESIAH